MNSGLQSSVTISGHGCLVSHASLAMFAVISGSLFGISLVLNQSVAGSIMVMHHNCKVFFLPWFLCIAVIDVIKH